MTGRPIRVLVVEDEKLLADAHREYVERIPGFTTVAVARSGQDALRELSRRAIDLVLLDFYLPDMSGLDVCRAMRSAGVAADVIAVTSAREMETVRAAISQGVVQYLLKPFSFAAMRDKLQSYAKYRAALDHDTTAQDQAVVDRALAVLRGSPETALPKGLSQATLSLLAEALEARTEPASASDLAAVTGVSRVTARRYLEHLVANGAAEQSLRYAKAGRPEILYFPRSR
ncbi:MAG TPA: response regulator [Nocardioidaceae bacterium]|nr:response regulator [Nocardioidaceae bacterium]